MEENMTKLYALVVSIIDISIYWLDSDLIPRLFEIFENSPEILLEILTVKLPIQ